ncbi:hypothetical protein Syun_023308 [Stephania yunnanensis]|uniref:Uncharacterized protein n=1 Tax=Stephania yunnanensis TaxID=152371 RepID=A0AAP0FHR9_9MAGN
MTRLWRPEAQRNLKSQWLKFVSQNQQWAKASSSDRSHLTSLVNSYLSQRYVKTLDDISAVKLLTCILFHGHFIGFFFEMLKRYMGTMDLGVLSNNMPIIRQRACQKLARQQPIFPKSSAPKALDLQPNKQLSQEDLEVHITAWFVEYNIDNDRVADIFKIVGEEMHFNLSGAYYVVKGIPFFGYSNRMCQFFIFVDPPLVATTLPHNNSSVKRDSLSLGASSGSSNLTSRDRIAVMESKVSEMTLMLEKTLTIAEKKNVDREVE